MDESSRLPFRSNAAPTGMTLVELMVVVAIIAVLAAIGGVAYTQYISEGKMQKLKQYAMEVKSGQESYKSRNGYYLDISGEYYNSNADINQKWEELLDFRHPSLENQDIEVRTEAGSAGQSCSNSDVCVGGMSPNTSDHDWWAVSVTQDLDSSVSDDTIIYLDIDKDDIVILNEGQ